MAPKADVASPGLKEVKPGEVIGDVSGKKLNYIYIVKNGRFLVNIGKEEVVELLHAQAPQCLGEEALFSAGGAAFNAVVAIESSQVIEIPIDVVKTQYQKLNPFLTQIIKGLSERIRGVTTELKTFKLARKASPCPADYIAKVFGVTFHAARFVGKQEAGLLVVSWVEFLDYAVNVLEETPYRLQQALRILTKLGYAKIDIEKSGTIEFKDMTQIEIFFDFYQNYHFKPGYASLLKTSNKVTAITKAFLKISEPFEADRAGVVHMPFKPTIDKMKGMLGRTFEADQLFRLEQKGLMIKRTTTQDGGILSFWRAEFEQMLLNWNVLREVELWNKTGFVHFEEEALAKQPVASSSELKNNSEPPQNSAENLTVWQPRVLQGKVPQIRTKAPSADDLLCPVCLSEIVKEQKYCDICDHELKQ